jgi:hypothetical protein
MSIAVALVLLAIAASGVTVLALQRLFAGDRGLGVHRKAPANWAPITLDSHGVTRKELEEQLATLRAMVLQLRYELAEAQRGNEQSRVRDLELLRFRDAELMREAETRVLAAHLRGDALSREWAALHPSGAPQLHPAGN